jgi:type I restriction enzyme S subunit
LVLRPQSPEWFGFFVFHTSSEELVAFADARSTGTKMPRTNWKDMSSYPIALPPSELAAKFNGLARPAIDRLLRTQDESRTLAAIRDTLLPKLISGELRVPDAEKLLAESPA